MHDYQCACVPLCRNFNGSIRIVDDTSNPNAFIWFDNSNAVVQSASIPITPGTPHNINGIFSVDFSSATGHTMDAQWEVTVAADGTPTFSKTPSLVYVLAARGGASAHTSH